jgi:hypothetical protein
MERVKHQENQSQQNAYKGSLPRGWISGARTGISTKQKYNPQILLTFASLKSRSLCLILAIIRS